MQAIIPAAGLGTRMQAITGGAPKELLPLRGKPILQWIIEEALEAGVDGIVVVSSEAKPAIGEAIDTWRLGRLREANLRCVNQSAPLGLAHAILSAQVENEDALVLLGDCVFFGGSPCERMVNLVYRGMDGCIAVEEVPDEEVRRYGICEINDIGAIQRVLEKPQLSETASRWAIAARYAFSGQFMSLLADLYNLHSGAVEVKLTDLFVEGIQKGIDLRGVALQPGQQRIDCGTPEEYAAATNFR
jgi:UTP--glucose-1-phosphate uridylyltransferase